MKKYFMLLAVALVCGLAFTSCGGDDDDTTPTPTPTPQTNPKFNVYASIILNKNLAQYGHLEVTYTYKDKSEELQLKPTDNSDALPTTNGFAETVMKFLKNTYRIEFNSSDYIIRNVVINDLNKDENENAVFKLKFVVDKELPEFTDESNRTFTYPDVLGYTDGGLTMIRSSLRIAQGIRASKCAEWITNKSTQEVTVTFGPAANSNSDSDSE